MKRNKILALAMTGMLVLGSCVPSVTAHATEGVEDAFVLTEGAAEAADGLQPEELQEAGESQETVSGIGDVISEDAISVDEFGSLDEISEDISLSENVDDLIDDDDKVLKGEFSEESTYNSGELPVTDAKWVSAGRLSFKCPQADKYYTLFLKKPDGTIFRHAGLTVRYDGGEIYYSGPEHFLQSGLYSFAVKTTTRRDDYDNTSGTVINWVYLDYTRPDAVFDTPSNLRWLDDGTVTWDAVPGNPNYYVYFYKNSQLYHAMPNGTKTSLKDKYIDISKDTWTFKVIAYSDYPEQTAASEYSKESLPYIAPPNLNGLAISGDGNWYLYENGVVNESYSGLYNDAHAGWWLVLNGRVATEFNDLYGDATYGWWKIAGGKVDFGFTDLYESPSYGWWKINGGNVDFGYTDLYYSPSYGWWKVDGGRVDFGFTDFYDSSSYGWWKVNGGRVDFGFTDLYESPTYGWWKVNDGAVDFGFTDLYESPSYGWWLVNGGMVDFGYSDIFKSSVYGNWKVAGGAVDFGYTGVYDSERYGRCNVKGGQAFF